MSENTELDSPTSGRETAPLSQRSTDTGHSFQNDFLANPHLNQTIWDSFPAELPLLDLFPSSSRLGNIDEGAINVDWLAELHQALSEPSWPAQEAWLASHSDSVSYRNSPSTTTSDGANKAGFDEAAFEELSRLSTPLDPLPEFMQSDWLIQGDTLSTPALDWQSLYDINLKGQASNHEQDESYGPLMEQRPTNNEILTSSLKWNRAYQQELKSQLLTIEKLHRQHGTLMNRIKETSTMLARRLRKPASKPIIGLHLYQDRKGCFSMDLPVALDTSKTLRNYKSMVLKNGKWTEKERWNLLRGVRQQNQKRMMDGLMEQLRDTESGFSLDDFQTGMMAIHKLSERELLMNVQGLDWERLAASYVPTRTGLECRIHWTVNEHPLINKQEFSEEERRKLEEIVDELGGRDWQQIALKLDTNRTAAQCFCEYQRYLNTCLLRSRWTAEEDARLTKIVEHMGEGNWSGVAAMMPGRTGGQCLHRWHKTLKPNIKRGRWTKEEDSALREAVRIHGARNWYLVKQYMSGRTDVQCRERWVNVLEPSIKTGPFTAEEHKRLLEAVSNLGVGKWAKIAAEYLPGRTDNMCWREYKKLTRSAGSRKRPKKTMANESEYDDDHDLEFEEAINEDALVKAGKPGRNAVMTEGLREDILSKEKTAQQLARDLGMLTPTPAADVYFSALPPEHATSIAFKCLRELLTIPLDPNDEDHIEDSSEDFRRLEARFTAIFSWPALLDQS